MKRLFSRSREDQFVVVVDWNLGNTCPVQCHYCNGYFKSGTNPFPDLAKAKLIVDRIADKHRNSNRQVRFSFVGGEPTAWADLPELARHIRENWFEVLVQSSGSASLAYWEEIAPVITSVNLSHHSHMNFDHFVNVASLLRDAGKAVSTTFAMTPDNFEIMLARSAQMREAGFQPALQPLYADHTRRSRLLPYTAAQIDRLFPKAQGDIIIEGHDGNTTEIPTVNHVIHAKLNSFKGMKCGIGSDQIVIDQNGSIWGGWCRVGGALGNVHVGDFNIPESPVTCSKETCDNLNDLSVPKWIED